MAKTKPSEIEERRRLVRACVASKRELNGWDNKQVAAKCRFSVDTLRNRMDRPETFTLEELWNMGIMIYIYDGQSKLPDGDGLVEISGRGGERQCVN